MASISYPLTLYFDGRCPLCMAEMRNLMVRNTAGHLAFVDASAEGFEPPPGVSLEAMMQRLHAQAADGRWLQGVAVFAAMYEAVGLSWVARALNWRWARPLADACYPWVARHRYLIPRALVAPLFERALRRAAARSANRCAEGSCEREAS